MRKLKDLFLPYTILEKSVFFSILWFILALTLVLGEVWHPVFFVFSVIMGVLLILFSWAAFRCKYCDRFLWGVDARSSYCPYCGKPL